MTTSHSELFPTTFTQPDQAEYIAEIREAALSYEARGWAVVPVYGITVYGECACGPNCKSSAGKHPRGTGWNKRRMSAEQIHEWWSPGNWDEGEPVDGVGIVPRLSGLVVVDVDYPDRAEGLDLPETLTARSPRKGGGLHLYYSAPDGFKPRYLLPNEAGELKWDGYVVAAPSVHASGGRYRWLRSGTPVAPAVDWMRREERAVPDYRLMVKKGAIEGRGSDAWNWVVAMLRVDLKDARDFGRTYRGDKARAQGRPVVLFAIACRLARWTLAGALTEEQMWHELHAACEANGFIQDYGEDELKRVVGNAMREAAGL